LSLLRAARELLPAGTRTHERTKMTIALNPAALSAKTLQTLRRNLRADLTANTEAQALKGPERLVKNGVELRRLEMELISAVRALSIAMTELGIPLEKPRGK